MTELRLIPAASSAAFLDADRPLRRLPRAPRRPRPPEFHARFEDRALWYDCFWDHDGTRILLCGPPPMNLAPLLRRAQYLALPSRTPLRPAFHRSLSTMITALDGAPAGTTAVAVTLEGQQFELPVQPSHAAELAGRRVLFTMSRDNDLAWIAEWARWHAALHGTDAVVLFDNGSTRYAVGEIEETLLGVPGIARVAVPSWPHGFGPIDPAVKKDPYWSRFLQIASMSVTLRRFGALAHGLLNSDIDELSATRSGRSLYDLARESRGGLVVYRGTWIEPVAATPAAGQPLAHRQFGNRALDPKRAASRQRKWTLDPSRPWVQRLSVHPYWHWIEGRSLFAKSMPDDAHYWHFRGINTNWKEQRTATADTALEPDPQLRQAFAAAGMSDTEDEVVSGPPDL
ncbi:MAG TPA: hypothetical protein VGN80_15765 [Devosiaceae bacterium]|nr:hypothetical protein [Devosiaceae bacterium]